MASSTPLEGLKDEIATGLSPAIPASEPPPLVTPGNHSSMALSVLAVLAVIYTLHWAQEVLIPLVLGIFITFALGPIVTWLAKRKIPRAIGAAIVLISITATIVFAVYSLSDEAGRALDGLPKAVAKISKSIQDFRGGPSAIDTMQNAAVELSNAATEATGDKPGDPKGLQKVEIAKPTFNLRDYLWIGSMGAMALAAQAVLLFFLVYFLLVSGDMFKRKLVKITGSTLSEKRVTVEIINEINSQIERYLLVQLFTCTVVGVATWLIFAWIGVEYAALWGVVAGLMNAIPYVGPVVVLGCASIAAYLQFGEIDTALLVGGSSYFITSIEGFLLTPWLTSRAGRINAVAIFVGLLFWGWLWGIWGVLLGIPIVMVIKAVCDRIEDLTPIGELLSD